MLGDDSNDITYYKNLGYQAIKSSKGLQDETFIYMVKNCFYLNLKINYLKIH